MRRFLVTYFRLSKVAVTVVDLVLLLVGFALAYLLRFGFDIPRENISPFMQLIPIIVGTGYVLFSVYGLYSIARKPYGDIVFSLGIALALLQLMTMAATFLIREFAFPRSVFMIAFVLQWGLLSAWRYAVLRVRRAVHGEKQVLIIGDRERIERIGQKLLEGAIGWYRIRAALEPDHYEDRRDVVWDEIDTIVIGNGIDERIKAKIIEDAIRSHKHVMLAPDATDILFTRPQLMLIEDVPMVGLTDFGLTEEQKLIKRGLDIVLSLVGLIVALPLMLIIALMIKVTSEGPTLYVQERVTEGGRTFKLYKFRTMVKDAEKLTGPVLATERDPRVTKVGRFLRVTRLDELPQLFNVLKGDMSFIGPRPERPHFVKQFEAQLPAYTYRHRVKAGITGLAQVVGRYATEVEDKLALDLYYIKNYSLLLDLKILMITLKVVLTKEAAAGVRRKFIQSETLEQSGADV
ncbi:sugar transferase [Hydrogenibacillus sp. N12]|uniref:sugar transferase n=1 Tax=Hydrogenibacillus sp. N12 TaxID=2866627 RepID=UPI001C7DE10F|nr:sugar transferase [Hydrogenibacillus sp. N12]QZA32869.1 sugar transferase [Hydrogenibacillus sp. N12]